MLRYQVVISLLAIALLGCEKSKTAVDKAPGQTLTFAIEKIELQPGQGISHQQKVPDSAALKKMIEEGLYATGTFAKDAPRKVRGDVSYDVRQFELKGGGQASAAVIFGEFVERGARDAVPRKFVSEVIVDSETSDTDDPATLFGHAVKEFVQRIAAQARVQGAPPAELIAILEDEDETATAHLVALQELRDRGSASAAPAIRPFLGHEEDDLKMAAAAALVKLDDRQSYSKIIEVAGSMSRARNPNYIPMLYIVGDIGSKEAIAYLEAVAEGHGAPTIRRVAQEALDRARAGARPAQ